MKTVAVLLCCVFLAQATIFDSNIWNQWEEYKLNHKKAYGSHDEHEFRFKIFFDNLKKIVKHNQEYAEGKQTFTMGLNKYADLLNSEFVELMLKKVYDVSDKLVKADPLPKASLPDSVDWRAKGAVTGVKDQGHCGGCWAFSATGSIEGANFLKNGQLISLSEQQLMDCSTSYGNHGCSGGLEYNGFEYLIDCGGIESEADYPFEEKDGQCRFDSSKVAVTISSYKHLKKNDEDELKNAVSTIGPISIGIDAGSSAFQFYQSGVLNDKSCSSYRLNHSVLAVGYGVENGQEYWIVKNSWGPSWGDNGYIKMARNQNNQCGIAADASYPIV